MKIYNALAPHITARYEEDDLQEYAAAAATELYDKLDYRRPSTPKEADIIEKIIYGALLSIRAGCDIQSTANTAEYIGIQMLDDVDCYDTLYCPIMNWVHNAKTQTN